MKFTNDIAFKIHFMAIKIEQLSRSTKNADIQELKEYALLQQQLQKSSEEMMIHMDDCKNRIEIIKKEELKNG